MVGIFINDRGIKFTTLIMNGLKTVETRRSDTLGKYVGQRVGIVRTGRGPATLVGYATLSPMRTIVTDKETFDKLFPLHRVPSAGPYAFKDKKVLYHLHNIKPCTPTPIPADAVRHGRIAVEL